MKGEGKNGKIFCEAKTYMLSAIEAALRDFEGATLVSETVESIKQAGKIFVYGVGRSGNVGRAFAMRLVQLGLDSHFIGETTTPIVTDKDLVIIISRTGETYSALQTANIVRRLGTKLIVVTGEQGSKLSHAGNIVYYLNVGNDDKRARYAPLGTMFELTAFLLFDGIVAELMAYLGETEESMRARHAIWV